MDNGVCVVCGEDASARVKKKGNDDEEELILYYCRNCVRGRKGDEGFF